VILANVSKKLPALRKTPDFLPLIGMDADIYLFLHGRGDLGGCCLLLPCSLAFSNPWVYYPWHSPSHLHVLEDFFCCFQQDPAPPDGESRAGWLRISHHLAGSKEEVWALLLLLHGCLCLPWASNSGGNPPPHLAKTSPMCCGEQGSHQGFPRSAHPEGPRKELRMNPSPRQESGLRSSFGQRPLSAAFLCALRK